MIQIYLLKEYQNTLRIINNKKDSTKCCLWETHFKYKDRISEKEGEYLKDKEGHYIMIRI